MNRLSFANLVAAVLLAVGVLFSNAVASAQEQPREPDAKRPIVHDGKTLDEWVELLRDNDEHAHAQAARALIAAGPAAYAALSDVLSDAYDPAWEHAVDALVKLGEPAVPALLAAIYMEQSGDLRQNGGVAALQGLGATAYPALKRALDDKDEAVRLAVITALRLQIMGPACNATVKILDEVLRSHPDAAIRTHAAEGLGYVGYVFPARPEAVQTLIRALHDSSDDVKGMAAVGLVRLDAWRDQDVVPPLVAALNSSDETVLYSALGALGELGPAAEQAVPALLQALNHKDPMVAESAAEALGKIGQAALPALLEALNGPDTAVRAQAAKALEGIGGAGQAAAAQLIGMLKHEAAAVRAAAARALGEMADDNPEVVSRLIETLSDDNLRVRMAAVRALGRVGSSAREAVPALIKLIDKVDSSEHFAIYRAFGGIGPDAGAAIPVLEAALSSDVVEASKALSRIGRAAVPTLIKGLKSESADVRTWCAFALAGIGPDARDAVPTLIQIVTDDADARNPAIQALAAIGPDAAAAVPALAKALADGEKHVQYWALRALRQIGPEARAAKAAVLTAMQTDDQERRWAAVAALLAMGEVDDGLPVVRTALEDDNSHYQVTAIEMLGETGLAAGAAIPNLTRIMKDAAAEPYIRVRCAKALARISPKDGGGVEFLEDQLGKDSGLLALPAAFALVELGEASDAAVAELQSGLACEQPELLIACAGALAKVKPPRADAIELLRRKLEEKDQEMRVAAALALTEAGVVEPAAICLLGKQLRLEDGSGRALQAIHALAVVAGNDARAKAILSEATHHESDIVRKVAREALK